MSQNKFLYEQLAIERYRELGREREHMHLLASLPRHHQGVRRHIVSRLGTLLVAVGTRLEQVEQREGQGIRPIDDSVGELRALAAPHPAGARVLKRASLRAPTHSTSLRSSFLGNSPTES